MNQGSFGGHIENFKISDAVRSSKQAAYKSPSSVKNHYGAPVFTEPVRGNDNELNTITPKIYKHVYIHTPPVEDEVEQQPRVIHPNQGKQDTHYQIIFVKAPTPTQRPVEVVLPSPQERKTLVYVLVKKPEKSEIKFRAPAPTTPPKPEVVSLLK